MTPVKKTTENGKRASGIGKGTPGPGRRKGVPNRSTRAMRDAFLVAFHELGGAAGLAKWARKRPGDFYALAVRLCPRELSISGEMVVPHELHIHDAPRDAAGAVENGRG